ncbi:MAG: DHHW family protein [Sodaliphilus sp.]
MLNKLYIAIILIVFGIGVIIFDTFPRSTFSELEKRDLASFPAYTAEKLHDGSYFKAISTWFSDSEPYRDVLMKMSMQFSDLIGIAQSEENIRFHAAESTKPKASPENADIAEYQNEITANEKAKIAHAGIVLIGKTPHVRALMAYGGEASGGTAFANMANAYKKAFPKVNVYCMVIPTAIEFYCPDQAKRVTKPQLPTIKNIYKHLAPNVKGVDAYTPLAKHVKEDIFLRTDHHWAPLGAYYAAQQLAMDAGVPFKPLSSYDKHVIHGYVGSMYGYSKDISVKESPEDFVYYTPKAIHYTTTYINYQVNKDFKVTSESKPYNGEFFHTFKDGSAGAYCTFMGGDSKIVKVRTQQKNGRRIIVFKDSFGNPVPGFLFFSFEEVHVIDYRYFTKDIYKYVADNKITDIVFANNIFVAYEGGSNYMKFLHRENVDKFAPRTAEASADSKKEAATTQDELPPANPPSHTPPAEATPPAEPSKAPSSE